MRWVVSVFLAVAISVATPPASRAVEDISRCLIENDSPEAEEALREMMIAALMRKPKAEVKRLSQRFGLMIIQIATTACNASVDDLQSPAFQQAAKHYGGVVGERLIREAFN